MKILKRLSSLLLCSLFVLIINQTVGAQSDTLDLVQYLELANGKQIYPSEAQIDLLKTVMPTEAYQPAPKISNRAYWDKIAETKSGKDYLEKANAELGKAPEVPISDEIYRRANKEGNRGIYKPRYVSLQQQFRGAGDYRGYYAFGGSSMELGIKSQYVMKRDILAVGPL